MSNRVVVTGASRGLGRALSERYMKLGAEVWAGCREPETAADMQAHGAHVHELDVCDERSIGRFADRVRDSGGADVLINCAGVDARAFGARVDARGPFDLSSKHFLHEVEVNAVGPMLVTRAFREQLAGSPGAKVVNLSSRTGSMLVGAELCWDIGYNASKAALNAVTVRTAHLLAKDGVIVVAVHPGWVRTDMGGPDATSEPSVTAQGLVKLIDALTLEQSGAFLQIDGSIHPW